MNARQFQTRHRRKPARNEHCLQRAIANWCAGLGSPLVRGRFAAIPNGGSRDKITASKLKAEGVRAGMPDLIFWRETGRVLWMEVKNGTSGSLSASQKVLHAALKEDGHLVKVCRSLAEAMEAVKEFYSEGANE